MSGDNPPAEIDLASPDDVERLFLDAASANLDARCREGCVDVADARGTLLATGDIHDNPLHFARIVELARLEEGTDESPRRVTLHEVIHSGRLVNGVDLSHRALARVAAWKARRPERVHTLLANHELSQIVGMGVVKDGVRMKDAFDEGVAYVFGAEAGRVSRAIEAFIRSMALALVCGRGTDNGVLCAHSLPGADVFDRFDPSVLDRALTDDDYTPRRGSAHLMVWGRGYTEEIQDRLASAWGVRLFVLGHEKAERGWRFEPPRVLVMNSDHEHGAALEMNLASPPEHPREEVFEEGAAAALGWTFHALAR